MRLSRTKLLIPLLLSLLFQLPVFSQATTDSIPSVDSISKNDSIPSVDSIPKTKTKSNAPLIPNRPMTIESYRYYLDSPVKPDSSDLVLKTKKHFWRATAEVVGMNLGLWAFDRYVQDGDYAHISWKSIKNNFRKGFKWDDDYLPTNFFAHPYNGSLFYNAGRSNGFNFWQSSLYAIGGSSMWELFMECEPPSTNDIIATPITGTAFGEIFYRASDLVIDDRSTGGERVAREVGAFIIDPMRGITRLLSGEMWKKRSRSGRRFGIPPICAEISLGVRGLTGFTHGARSTRGGFLGRLFVEYGDPFEESTRKPYDYFTLLLEFQRIKTQPPFGRIEIAGRLLSTDIIERRVASLNVGLYQHFDYFDSDTIKPDKSKQLIACPIPYKLATPANFGVGALFRFNPNPTFCLDAFAHLNAVILAGTLTDYYRNYHRSYNYASGFSVKAGGSCILFTDRLWVKLNNDFYRLYTWSGYRQGEDWSDLTWGTPTGKMGDKSNSYFNHLALELKGRLFNHWYVSAGLDLYSRITKYHDYTYTYPATPTSLAVAPLAAESRVVRNPKVRSNQLGYYFLFTYRF